jgi:hypothetical protein
MNVWYETPCVFYGFQFFTVFSTMCASCKKILRHTTINILRENLMSHSVYLGYDLMIQSTLLKYFFSKFFLAIRSILTYMGSRF